MIIPLTGVQYEIEGGHYRATVTELGAGLRELTFRGQPVIAGYQADELPPAGAGQLLAPWPNRVDGGRYVFGGTEYLFDGKFPLAVRLMSLFHVGLPVVLVAAVRRVGYDRRALAFQAGVTAGLLLVARAIGADKNMNFSMRAPLCARALGPPPVHLTTMLLAVVVVLYLPPHLILKRWFSRR